MVMYWCQYYSYSEATLIGQLIYIFNYSKWRPRWLPVCASGGSPGPV